MSNMSSCESICPFCLRPVELDAGGNGKCTGADCQQVVRHDDWPEIPGCPDFNPTSSIGLGKKPDEGYPYRARVLEERGKGVLYGIPIAVTGHESDVWLIGSEKQPKGDVKFVRIDGIPGHQAAIVRRKSDETWWVYDFGNTECGTFLNHQRVNHLERVEDGNLIEVGGVRLKFDKGILKNAQASDRVKVEVEGLEATVPDKSAEGGRKVLLQGVSFAVHEGEFVGIIGPSGCGKSSLIQRLAGLACFDKGEIKFRNVKSHLDGVSLPKDRIPSDGVDELRKSIGYLPQNVELALHDELSLEHEIACFCRIHQITHTPDEVCKIVEQFGLKEKVKDRIAGFSGGEKRRVGIALAMLRRPEILLLDEPCAGLDPQSESELMKYVFKLCQTDGVTVLCVTHALGSAHLFDKLLVLKNGGGQAAFDTPDGVQRKFGIRDLKWLYGKLGCPTPCGGKRKNTWKERLRCWWECLRLMVCEVKDLRVERCNRCLGHVARCLGRVVHKVVRPRFCIGVFSGYFWRSIHNVSMGQVLLQIVLQPLFIAVGIRWACAVYFRSQADGGPIDEGRIVAFCATLSMFWIGLNNSARELVKERVPGRCLERLENVPLAPYLMAKFSWSFLLCLVQSLLFCLLVKLLGCWPVALEGWAKGTSSLSIPFLCFMPMLVTCLIGSILGFGISALAKKEQHAVFLVPIFAILALLLSPTIMPFEGGNDMYVPWIANLIQKMPCYWPSKWFYSLQCNEASGGAAATSVGWCVAYLVFAFVFVAMSTFVRERAWEGRGKE